MTPPLAAGDLLAVYGLLRPGADGLDRLHLRASVRSLGPCRVPGLLIDLGPYPGLIQGEGEVRGDLLELLDARAGPILDAFEDFDPENPERSAYRRVRVRLLDPDREAWAYIWNGSADDGRLLPGGDWLTR